MDEANEILTDSELMKKALLLVQRLKNSGLDHEIIFARLEKQGIPDHIAKEAVKDVNIEFRKIEKKEAKTSFDTALLRIGLGVGAAIVFAIIFPGIIIIPVGLIGGGIIYALLAKKKME